MHRSRVVVALAGTFALLGALILAGTGPAVAAGGGSATIGNFLEPFSPNGDFNVNPPRTVTESMRYPTAVSIAALPNGKFVYWNGLEDLENDTYPLALDATRMSLSSRSRQMIAPGASAMFQTPTPEDGGDEDMFCADLRILLNGDVLVAGGTRWRFDPVDLEELSGGAVTEPGGTAELFGSNATRFFHSDGSGGTWTQTDLMDNGRWYPAMLTLPDGRLLIAGGVGRLLYNFSGINVRPIEVFNPYDGAGNYAPAQGTWTNQGASAEQTLPLFPRLHLTAQGKVFYDGVGQMWGPFGQATDQALWNVMKSYDPATKTWTDKGTGNYGALSGAVSIMLPFRAGESHNTTRILHGGGVLGTSPGLFFGTSLSELITISPTEEVTAATVPDTVNRRWYSSGVIGADGNIFMFSGADKDEVVAPGIEFAVRQAEMYDVANNKWVGLDTGSRDRTYHNSAILLADGSMLIGGHSPINTLYGSGHNEAPDGTTIYTSNDLHNATKDTPIATANNLKDSSFEIYKPPYLFKGPQPSITTDVSNIMQWGSIQPISTPDSATVQDAILVHMSSTTHTTDADLRALEVKIVDRNPGQVKIQIPSNSAAAVPGYYYLFLRRTNTNEGFTTPTVSNGIVVRVGNDAVFGGAAAEISPVTLASLRGKTAPVASTGGSSTAAIGSAVVEQASIVRTGRGGSRDSKEEGASAVAAAALLTAAGALLRVRRKERAPA